MTTTQMEASLLHAPQHWGTKSTRINVRVTFVLTLLWVILTLWNFGLPGLYMDEVNHYAFIPGILSEEAAKLHHYRLFDNWIDYQDSTIRYPTLGGTVYNTPIRTYISIPYFLLSGFSVESLRIFSALLGLAAIISASTLIDRIYGALPALLASAIIMLDPQNAFSIRSQGGLFWMIVMFSALAGHFLLSAHRKGHPQIWHAVGSAASISLAVACYFVGAIFALPLIILGLVIFKQRPWLVAVFLLTGILVYSPVIYGIVSIYLKTPGALGSFGIPDQIQNRSTSPGPSGFMYAYNVARDTFGKFYDATTVTGAIPSDFLANIRLLAVAAGLIVIPAISLLYPRASPQHSRERTAFQFFFWTVLAVYFIALITTNSLSPRHLIPVSMLVAIFIATYTVSCSTLIKRAAIGLCISLVATGTISLIQAHTEVKRTGGRALFNENVTLPAKLFRTTLRDYHPVFASWGFHLQYLFLTGGTEKYSFMTDLSPERIKIIMRRHQKVAFIVAPSDREKVLQYLDFDEETYITTRDGNQLYSIGLIDQKRNSAKQENDGISDAQHASREAHTLIDAAPIAPPMLASSQVDLCREDIGTAVIEWNFDASYAGHLQIYVVEMGGKRTLWSAPSKNQGTRRSGKWVRDGASFEAVDSRTGETLASVKVETLPCF